ncbi:acyl-homoserine-lactone synthase [Serratia odorifera]|uniref:acyl-homoserine-lactone synthase n=1 Tax=Serratia odorifera TaxID=618 RepID=UPI0018E70A28|nr:acyl-homoserine-lactone synthase [Serratia odorifera]MBJ2066587.1 hypothetical protein [Serratia odorifera]
MMKTLIAARAAIDANLLQHMHQLRADTFYYKKRWDVVLYDGMEIDAYDALNPLYLLLLHEDGERIDGCWRMLPTTGPYMLKNTFPSLLGCHQPPCSEAVWELSRFINCAPNDRGLGFSSVTRQMIEQMMAYGRQQQLTAYVTVTTLGVERMMRHLGLVMRRLGPGLTIGREHCIALQIDLS